MRKEFIEAMGLHNISEGEPVMLYPWKGMKETEGMKEYERQLIAEGAPLPPAEMLEPGSLVHTEALRRENIASQSLGAEEDSTALTDDLSTATPQTAPTDA